VLVVATPSDSFAAGIADFRAALGAAAGVDAGMVKITKSEAAGRARRRLLAASTRVFAEIIAAGSAAAAGIRARLTAGAVEAAMSSRGLPAVSITSLSFSGSGITRFTPLMRTVTLEIPARPIVADPRTSLPASFEGMVGLAVNGVPLVAEHMDVTGQRLSFSLKFDECGGHGDGQHRYHYHMPPVCLLQSLGGV